MPELYRQGVRVVRHHGADQGHRAELAAPRGEHERVRVDDVAEAGHGTDRPDLSPVGMIATTGRRATATAACPPAAATARSPGRAAGPPGTRVCPAGSPRPWSARSARAPRAPSAGRAPAPGPVMTMLPSAAAAGAPHDHGVRAGRHRVAGVDPLERPGGQPHRRRPPCVSRPRFGGDGGCRGEVGRAHRDPVHGRAVGARRRPPGPTGPAVTRPSASPTATRSLPGRRPASRVPPCPGRGDQPARQRVEPPLARDPRDRPDAPAAGLTARPRYGQAPASCR